MIYVASRTSHVAYNHGSMECTVPSLIAIHVRLECSLHAQHSAQIVETSAPRLLPKRATSYAGGLGSTALYVIAEVQVGPMAYKGYRHSFMSFPHSLSPLSLLRRASFHGANACHQLARHV